MNEQNNEKKEQYTLFVFAGSGKFDSNNKEILDYDNFVITFPKIPERTMQTILKLSSEEVIASSLRVALTPLITEDDANFLQEKVSNGELYAAFSSVNNMDRPSGSNSPTVTSSIPSYPKSPVVNLTQSNTRFNIGSSPSQTPSGLMSEADRDALIRKFALSLGEDNNLERPKFDPRSNISEQSGSDSGDKKKNKSKKTKSISDTDSVGSVSSVKSTSSHDSEKSNKSNKSNKSDKSDGKGQAPPPFFPGKQSETPKSVKVIQADNEIVVPAFLISQWNSHFEKAKARYTRAMAFWKDFAPSTGAPYDGHSSKLYHLSHVVFKIKEKQVQDDFFLLAGLYVANKLSANAVKDQSLLNLFANATYTR